jgi:hypothetical protein
MTDCPMCDLQAVPMLDSMSGEPIAGYYRCNSCGYVWMARNDGHARYSAAGRVDGLAADGASRVAAHGSYGSLKRS